MQTIDDAKRSMNLENAIREISVRQDETRKSKVFRAVTIAVAVATALTAILVCLMVYMTFGNIEFGLPPHLTWRHPVVCCGGLIPVCWILGYLAVWDHTKSLKKHDEWERHWLTCVPKDDGEYYQRGSILYDYGFFEEALCDFNQYVQLSEAEVAASQEFSRIKERFTKPGMRMDRWTWEGEGIQRFFEDYPDEMKIVKGFPRPVPFHTPYELERLEAGYDRRRDTLLKLGRDAEAKVDEEKINTILELIQEKYRLEKEYAKMFADGPTPYDD